MVRLTSTGINGNTNKVIQVDADFFPPILLPVDDFALFADFAQYSYSDIDFEGTGIIIGDVHAGDEVEIQGGLTVTGTISEGSPSVAPPPL